MAGRWSLWGRLKAVCKSLSFGCERDLFVVISQEGHRIRFGQSLILSSPDFN